jgi:integrase
MPIIKTNDKKDGLVKYRVIINYKDHNGAYKKKERTAYGLAAAKEMEKVLSIEVNKGEDDRMTVQELVASFLAVKKNEVRETTYAKIECACRLYIAPYIGHIQLAKISAKNLQDWKQSIYDLDLSVVTKNNAYKELRSLLNFAVKMQYIKSNPISTIGNFKDVEFQGAREKICYYTPEQFKVYKKTMEDTSATYRDWCFYVFFMIAYYTGARKGEINALKWSDIDGNTIMIRRSVAQKLKGGDRETPPKNRSSIRDIQMPLPLIEILSAHRERQKNIPGFSEDFRVCGGTDCLRDTTIDKRNRAIAKAADLPLIRVHDFRHSHASLLANEGINIQEVARRLGHSDVQMTWQVYSHLYPREEERALKILNKIE